MINIDISSFLNALSAIANEIGPTVERSLDTIAEIAVVNAQSNTLFKNQTGKLRKSIHFTRDGDFARTVIADATNEKGLNYAYYVENGNDPGGGRIYPKKAKALRFVIDGKVIFAKSVKAAKPRPFMLQAEFFTELVASDIIISDLQTMIAKHTKG